ncbi:MAG: secretin N-terminal domain-containing protein [Planctomycetota bacterium]
MAATHADTTNEPRTRRASTAARRLLRAAGLSVGVASMSLAQDGTQQQQQQGRPQGEQAQRQQQRVTPPAADDVITISPFAEPVELRILLDIAVRELGVQIAVDTSLTGTVVITQELRIPRNEFLGVINSFLEQNNFALVPGALEDFYEVRPTGNMPVTTGDSLPTTLIIRTPNSKPSIMQQAISAQVAATSGQIRLSALDELGVLIVTATPGKVVEVRRLVESILSERSEQGLIPFDLRFVSAPAARERVLQFAGVESQQFAVPATPTRGQGRDDGQGPSIVSALSNLGERLIVAPTGNRLIFRGTPDEAVRVAELLELVDQRDTLEPRRYFTGTVTRDIGRFAELRGLGTVIEVTTADAAGGLGGVAAPRQIPVRGVGVVGGDAGQQAGGSLIAVDEAQQSIVYYGTAEQQDLFAEFVERFRPGDDQIIIRPYRLSWADAESVADLLTELVEGTRRAVDSPFQQGSERVGALPLQPPPGQVQQGQTPLGDATGDVQSEEAFVTFDEGTNQVFVRAPQRLQPQFERIIQTIDRRRPQVFIDAKIVAVTWSDDMRLAFETQLINAGGSGGVLQQNFGLTEASGDATETNVVTDALLGLTAAVVQTDFVPIIINALQNQVNGRILASPQLLVDDNTEASIASIEEQPFTTATQGSETTEVSFGGFEEAGTTLTVTPQINANGFVTLSYDVELSDFIGAGSDGIPPPRTQNNVTSESVTIPSDSTIVVGGITVDDVADTIISVPLLGDIPLIGLLFRDTNLSDSKTTVYVFITPTVLYNPTISDYELLTEGPREVAGLGDDLPPLETSMVRVLLPLDIDDPLRREFEEPIEIEGPTPLGDGR